MKKCMPAAEPADTEDLFDVGGLIFDNAVPRGQRAAWLLKRVKNPYRFRVGDLGVRLEFSDNAPTLQTLLTDFLTRGKNGL